MYKLTNSVDNRLRTTISIKIRVTLEDIATFITVQESDELWTYGPGLSEKVISQAGLEEVTENKGRVMKIVMDCVRNYGTEAPHYRIVDDSLEHICEAVLELITKLWAK